MTRACRALAVVVVVVVVVLVAAIGDGARMASAASATARPKCADRLCSWQLCREFSKTVLTVEVQHCVVPVGRPGSRVAIWLNNFSPDFRRRDFGADCCCAGGASRT